MIYNKNNKKEIPHNIQAFEFWKQTLKKYPPNKFHIVIGTRMQGKRYFLQILRNWKGGEKMNVTINTKRMRIMIGILGMLLPWLVALITLSWPQSISITYYSVCAVGTFMVVLGSAGMLLINYKGYSLIDDICGTAAGIFGILICLFPMIYPSDPYMVVGAFNIPSHISNIFHSIAAMCFFGILAFMSFFLFTRTSDKSNMTKKKKIKNIIYRVCGIGMIGSFLLLLLQCIPGFNCYNLVWIVEAIALFFFGLSWIVKSDAIPFLHDNK